VAVQDLLGIGEEQAEMPPKEESIPTAGEAGVATVDDGASGLPQPGEFDPTLEWEPPQGVPLPADDAAAQTSNNVAKKDVKQMSKVAASPKPHPSKSEPSKTVATAVATSSAGIKKSVVPLKPVVPFYVDLAYLPTSAGSKSTFDMDFFRRIRAGHYVLPGTYPSPHTVQLLIDAKTSWPASTDETHVVPTGDTESLAVWIKEHTSELESAHISIMPSVSNCTLTLEQSTSCKAFRIEF